MTMLQIRKGCVDSVGIQVNRLVSVTNQANKNTCVDSPDDGCLPFEANDATFCKEPNLASLSHAPYDEHTGRRDALPEYYDYRDTGCELSPSCLTCPLAQCRYDAGVRELRQNDRQRRIVELRRQGWDVTRVARELGVSRRTVFRLSKA